MHCFAIWMHPPCSFLPSEAPPHSAAASSIVATTAYRGVDTNFSSLVAPCQNFTSWQCLVPSALHCPVSLWAQDKCPLRLCHGQRLAQCFLYNCGSSNIAQFIILDIFVRSWLAWSLFKYLKKAEQNTIGSHFFFFCRNIVEVNLRLET